MKMNPVDDQIVREGTLKLTVDVSKDELWCSKSAKHHERWFDA
jgi:hypothetical protein